MNHSATASQSIFATTMSLQNFLPFQPRSPTAQAAHPLSGCFRRSYVVNDRWWVIVADDAAALALCLPVHLPGRMNPAVRDSRQLRHPLTDEATRRILIL